ncbi:MULTISPECIES: sigma-70 family RNA polymerase sigma factor [Carnobacterium]|uniref:sigma-70 family RNA polymerase sigma factor n=1 Tax=Carnobacterium TaxID=2747 RepID=UPI001072AC10|nr:MULTISPECIES: sigma-70 family RNA polymerase sigma factor [Carnobacterium]MDT1938664.1 sigma-70 family RNA polymerase sigma factor [Carnobacterium divergens]MDT1941102.1 sigma-70 family RNA polymerase sigma factor [Carnobacterium divergens]MDT1946900.1 sigma-70 family RNA polymerase sigma factor [Carnobacterium divergens]MDT1949337.1 sigma-70 family RNA polymerase sigma factor [Carnobacterium divergens]MDT1954515.1 sigma-70 family RNA polymerase sigma factor [Carnobacterium divergens]
MDIKRIVQAIKGDKLAFEGLLLEMQEQLYRTAYIYMQNKEDALDVLQETAYLGMKSIYQLRDPSLFKTWLTRILINTALKELKQKKKVHFSGEEQLIFLKTNEVENDLDLVRAIGMLKEDYRIVIILHYYQGLSIKELSLALNIPEGTIKTNLSRGRKCLKTLLEEVDYNGFQTN